MRGSPAVTTVCSLLIVAAVAAESDSMLCSQDQKSCTSRCRGLSSVNDLALGCRFAELAKFSVSVYVDVDGCNEGKRSPRLPRSWPVL